MKKENNDLDEFFREKLSSEKNEFGYSQIDWDDLERKLVQGEKTQRRQALISKTLMGAAAALVMCFSIWLINRNESNSTIPPDTFGLGHALPEVFTDNEEKKQHLTHDIPGRRQKERYPISLQDRAHTALIKEANVETRREPNKHIHVYTLDRATESTIPSTRLGTNQLPFSQASRLNHQLEGLDQVPESKSRKNVVFSILVAPALNGVKGFKEGEVGGDFGFLVSVDLTKRLSVSTGAVYAKKRYEADFNSTIYPRIGGYEYTKGAYTQGASVFPESVYADCSVLDIPLNVNYSIISKGKNKISIGTGMSSYIMLKEKYQFEYLEPSTDVEKLELTNENKHFMSVLNFQASYTRQLNSKVGISLQPYLKIPLVDIGYAETKLQTIGMAVNVNFSLTATRK